MRCEEVQEQLGHYVDGELPAADAEAVSVHLEGCLACQVDHVSLKQARERISSLPRVKAPEALLAGVAARIGAAPAVAVQATPTAAQATPAAAHSMPKAAHSTESLSAFLDDELLPAERDEVREHIASCGECSQALVSLDDLVGRVRTLPKKSAPVELVGLVLDKIGPQVIAPAAPVQPARVATTRRIRPPGGGEPFQLGPGARRFLAAASLFVLSLGALAFATPNTSAGITTYGSYETFVANAAPARPSEGKRREETVAKDRTDPERTFALLCADLDAAPAALQVLAQAHGLAMTPVNGQANTWTFTGSSAALHAAFAAKGAELPLEDAAHFAEVVPVPMDKVQTRNGETLGGIIQKDDRNEVVLAATTALNALPDPGSLGPGDGLAGEYFAVDGAPSTVPSVFGALGARPANLASVDATIDCATPGAEPGGHGFAAAWKRTANFAVRWRGYFAAEQTGAYTFTIGSDDGALLDLDERTVGGYDGAHGYAEYPVSVVLQRGLHAVTLRYFNGGGPGVCRLLVAAPGRDSEVVPQRLLYSAERVERGRRTLTLAIPRRSVVKVVRASSEPVTIHVVLKKRTD